MGIWYRFFRRKSVRLLNRGEQFEVVAGVTSYHGECVWAWEGRSTYPITLIAASIYATGDSGSLLTHEKKIELADTARLLLERECGPGNVRVVSGLDQSDTSRG